MNKSNPGAWSEDYLRHQQNEELQELHRQLREKDRIFENYKKSRGGLEVFFRKVQDAIRPVSPLPQRHVAEKKRTKTTVFAVNQTSDSHMGAVQGTDEIEGLNGFNPKICESRNMNFARMSLSYFNTMRSAYNVNELVWLYTGDLVSGDIHQELLTTNAFPLPVQVAEAAGLHAKQVAFMAPHFEHIRIEFIVDDNHARLTKKPQASEAGYNSMNYLVGVMMKQYLSSHTNVEVNIYPMHEKVIKVGNMRYLIMHGHSIQGWMGVPWYGIERRAGKEATARMQAIMQSQDDQMLWKMKELGFHKMVHGHFHVNFDGPMYACAASIQGTTAYDHKDGRFSPPGQPSWLVGPKGEFARTNFKLL